MKKQLKNVVVAVVLTAAAAPCAVQAMNAFELAKVGFSITLPSRSELERRENRKAAARTKAAATKNAKSIKNAATKKAVAKNGTKRNCPKCKNQSIFNKKRNKWMCKK